ncbi:MAG: anthranilate synthase component I family protein [Planctomycetes bacterium]|nr:anthranilate synthase component I family protein [Planctomycetota bacterium]
MIDCKLISRKVSSNASLQSVTHLFASGKHPAILGGNLSKCDSNRFSVWSAEPVDIFEFTDGDKKPFDKLAAVIDRYTLDSADSDLPNGMFRGGWIGYFSYDLRRYIEKVPNSAENDLHLPLIRLCFYDNAICYDHRDRSWYLLALQMGGDTESAKNKISKLKGLLAKAEKIKLPPLPDANLDNINVSQIDCNMSRNFYTDALAKTKQYIIDGEVYQINFSQRFACPCDADPAELYRWQNEHNPSPYAAYIGADDFALVSASPEMFVTIDAHAVSTKPIKGTRPRLKDCQAINQLNFTELVESEKDQAELNMIIDLERNDLTRFCRYGTIKVTQPRTIEAYPTVYHAVATVEGKLRQNENTRGENFCEMLKAMFPGGSITGAPKIRSMEIIDELEPTRRNAYTGSIGFIGIDGNACLNIAIRTVIITNKTAYVQTGGGIVADSDTNEEWDETITKARALLAGIAAVNEKTATVKGN